MMILMSRLLLLVGLLLSTPVFAQQQTPTGLRLDQLTRPSPPPLSGSDLMMVQPNGMGVAVPTTLDSLKTFFTQSALPTMSSIAVSPGSFQATAGNATNLVGALSTIVTSGTFVGDFGLATSSNCLGPDNGKFTTSGTHNESLHIGASDITVAKDYTLCVRATDINFSNNPFFWTVTVTGTAGAPTATINSIVATPSSFTSASTNATNTVGALSALVSTGSFGGTFALATGANCDSTDNAKFTISSPTLKIGSAALFNGIPYRICVSATDVTFSNSPKIWPLTITGVGPSVVLANSTIAPGDPIVATFAGGAGMPADWIGVYTVGDGFLCCNTYLNGSQSSPPVPQLTSGTVTLAGSESTPGTYEVHFHADPGTSPTTIALTTLTVSVTPQISSVGLNPATFPAQAGNAGSTIGTLAPVVTGGGSFSGTNVVLATGLNCPGPDNGKFATSGLTLKVGGSDITIAGPYTICVLATDNALGNSPKLWPITVTGTAPPPPATITFTSVNPTSFAAMTGNANHPVGTLSTVVSNGVFGGTYALATGAGCTSTDNGSFTIPVGTNALNVHNADVTTLKTYHICVSATDSAFTNSPKLSPLSIVGAPAPSLSVAGGSSVVAGTPASITLTNGFGFTRDWINIVPSGSGSTVVGTWAYLNGSQTAPGSPVALPATISLTVPTAGSYEIRYLENDTFVVGATTPLTVTPATVTSAPGPLVLLGSNPRLFKTPDGKGIYLTGVHTWPGQWSWANFGTYSFPAYIDYVSANYHQNFTRYWAEWMETVDGPSHDNGGAISPLPFNRSSTPGAFAGNKFDLTSYNQAHFDKMKANIEYAASKGIYVMVCLFVNNDYGNWGTSYWNGTQNINGTVTDPLLINSNPGSTTLALQKAYVHKILDTLANEPNVLYEVANEPAPNPDLSVSFTWQEAIVTEVHAYEAAHAYMIHPIAEELNDSQAGIISGDIFIPYELNAAPTSYSLGKPVIVDTDHIFGFGGGTDWWWKSFMLGNNLLSMDDFTDTGLAGILNLGGTGVQGVVQNRAAVPQVRSITSTVDMTAMAPSGGLSSTGYALADTAGHNFIVYNGGGGAITLDLSSASGVSLNTTWLNTATGLFGATTTITGGSSSQAFAAPFGGVGPAVLMIVPNGAVGPPQINTVTLSPSSFVAVAPNANQAIGTLTTQVSAGSFAGNYTKTTGVNCPGADNNSFTLSGSSNATVSIAGTSLTQARNYDLCIAANDSNFSNSGKLQQITIQGGVSGCGGGPAIATNKSTYAPGETITVTANCGSGNPADWLVIAASPNENAIGAFGGSAPYETSFNSSAIPFTTTLSAPNIKADRDVQFSVVWLLNNSFSRAAETAPFTVSKAIDPAAPVATLPSGLAADPFTPDHVVTVCLTGGCNYTSPADAISAINTAGWDNVKINISAGEYDVGSSGHLMQDISTHHMWIRGLSPDGGKTRAHLFGKGDNSNHIIGEDFLFSSTGAPSLTLDNLEIGPWNYWTIIPRDYRTFTMRNVYLRDTTEGILSANSVDFTINIYNSVVARSGGSDGPEHDVYIGEGAGGMLTNVVNSVFDRSLYGHTFKERSKVINFTCDMFVQNSDDVYAGSETVDMDSGSPTFTNILSVNGAGSPKSWTDQQSFDNLRYGLDWEAILDPNVPAITGSNIIAEQPGSAHPFWTLGIPLTHPVTFTGNKWVWHDSAGSGFAGPGGCAPNFPQNSNQVGSPDGAVYAEHTGCTTDVTINPADIYIGLAAAGLPTLAGSYPRDWREFLPWMPAACTDPIGLVHVPSN